MNNVNNIFTFENVSFGYHAATVNSVLIRNFSGDFRTGEFIAVIGRNGTGKSTVLKSLVRLIPLIQGKILLRGRPINHYSPSEYARIISFVSTDLPKTAGMTVFEMVALGRFPHTNWLGSLKREDHAKINTAIELTGLRDLQNKPLFRISDGERQRAMIARTLAQDTPIIILDEPTAFLDLPNKYELAGLLVKLASMGKTIIMSTHDTGIALRFPDKLLIINDNLLTFGSPEDQILCGEFSRIFQSPDFHIDRLTGEIEIFQENGRKISVEGNDEVLLTWTRKALKRAGFKVSDHQPSGAHIKASSLNNSFSFQLMYNNESVEFKKIYDLITYIKTNLY